MQFTKKSTKSFPPGRHNPLHQDMLGSQLESSSAGKDLVDKLTVSQQCALAAQQANSLPGKTLPAGQGR